jgi:hypothetical protein
MAGLDEDVVPPRLGDELTELIRTLRFGRCGG